MDDLWIGDRLPTVYEVALAVFHYSKKTGSKKRKDVIRSYAKALRTLWVKSFTETHVLHLETIIGKVEQIMNDYRNRVQCSHSSNKSSRILHKQWMGTNIQKLNKRGPSPNPMKVSSLFDIGKDTDKLTGNEKLFYEDQRGSRHHLLSQEVDIEYEDEQYNS